MRDKKTEHAAVIFLNGNINTSFSNKFIINKNLSQLAVYAADGAIDYLDQTLISKTKLIVGDGDSIVNKDDKRYYLCEDQSKTDFDKLLNVLTETDYNILYIFGFNGKEMDHYLTNLTTAYAYKDRFKIYIIDEYSCSYFIPREWCIKNIKGRMVSVIPYPFAKNVVYKGLHYPLDGVDISMTRMLGTRNFADKEEVHITYSSGDILVMIGHYQYSKRNIAHHTK